MAKTATPAAPVTPVTEDKPKRTMLTPEQKVAKLEAELKAAREKADARKNKARNEALAKRAKYVAKIKDLQGLVDHIDQAYPPATDEDTES